MTAHARPAWRWQVSRVWALLGPSLVLLVQIWGALVLLDAAGGERLSGDVHGELALLGGVVLVATLGAQLSAALVGMVERTRNELAESRCTFEEGEIAAEYAASALGGPLAARYGPIEGGRRLTPSALLPMRLLPRARPDSDGMMRIVSRFGLLPSWAFGVLDNDLGVPAARALTRQVRMTDARWAGHLTACLFSPLALLFVVLIVHDPGPKVGFAAGVCLLFIGQLAMARASGRAVLANEAQFYPRLETLLEFNRFDLYRALAVPTPRSSKEERGGLLAAWRLGFGDVSLDTAEAADSGDVRQQVAGLAELLQGPELVPYDGFVSWDAQRATVELAFARNPVLKGGHARLQVAGSGTARTAPFDITADSSDVALVQVRASVQAPVDGEPRRVTFDFQRSAEALDATPELWFEISQQGRFIQLLRVRAPYESVPPSG